MLDDSLVQCGSDDEVRGSECPVSSEDELTANGSRLQEEEEEEEEYVAECVEETSEGSSEHTRQAKRPRTDKGPMIQMELALGAFDDSLAGERITDELLRSLFPLTLHLHLHLRSWL